MGYAILTLLYAASHRAAKWTVLKQVSRTLPTSVKENGNVHASAVLQSQTALKVITNIRNDFNTVTFLALYTCINPQANKHFLLTPLRELSRNKSNLKQTAVK